MNSVLLLNEYATFVYSKTQPIQGIVIARKTQPIQGTSYCQKNKTDRQRGRQTKIKKDSCISLTQRVGGLDTLEILF